MGQMIKIFVDTYMGANKTSSLMMSHTWAESAKAAASAGLYVGETMKGDEEQLDRIASRAVADMFDDDWSRTELTKAFVPWEIKATEELIGRIVNKSVKDQTFWQWVFDVETYGADTVTLYTGSYAMTEESFDNPRCI